MQLRALFSLLGSHLRHRSRAFAALSLLVAAPATVGATFPAYDVSLTVDGLRSSRGQVLACLTTQPATYPDCSKDPNARRRTVPASAVVKLDFGAVPQGLYAIAVIHDENGNGRMDKKLMLPSEGFGFSRDAPLRFGPPSFRSAAFDVDTVEHETIRMRYLL